MSPSVSRHGACRRIAGGSNSRPHVVADFVALLVGQFLLTLDDNMLRWVVVPIGKQWFRAETSPLTLGLLCFVLPYLFLAAPAGYLADRFSKRRILVGCQFAQIVLMTPR